MVKKLVCELNDYRISLLSKDELQYIEGFVFSLYSETFQIGNDMKVGVCSPGSLSVLITSTKTNH